MCSDGSKNMRPESDKIISRVKLSVDYDFFHQKPCIKDHFATKYGFVADFV